MASPHRSRRLVLSTFDVRATLMCLINLFRLPRPFLRFSPRLAQGLLDLAFDPGWADNSFFYLSFTVDLGAGVSLEGFGKALERISTRTASRRVLSKGLGLNSA